MPIDPKRVKSICERLNPPSYADKIPNCAYPWCDENGPCYMAYAIVAQLNQGAIDENICIDEGC